MLAVDGLYLERLHYFAIVNGLSVYSCHSHRRKHFLNLVPNFVVFFVVHYLLSVLRHSVTARAVSSEMLLRSVRLSGLLD
jgi:hypothetical protein